MCVRDNLQFDVEPPRREPAERHEQTLDSRQSRTETLRRIAAELRRIGSELERLDYMFWARAAWTLAKTVQHEADER